MPELRRALLQPLADAFAPFGSTQERPFVVELQLGVVSDLFHSGILASETHEHRHTAGYCLLRYLMSGSGSDTRGTGDPMGDDEPFYYIKGGVDEGVFWDDQDRVQQYEYFWGYLIDGPAG